MSLRIAVASGKGGTGKTTVSISLYRELSKRFDHKVSLFDCDVEEPNVSLFFQNKNRLAHIPVEQEIPVIDSGRCTFCRACAEYCEFNAILVIPPTEFAEVNPSLCHSCGACSVACNHDAIYTEHRNIGYIDEYEIPMGIGIREGRLRIGSAMQTMLIRSVKEKKQDEARIILLDAPPGTSCPVVETISACDYIVMVTEPTPFGLHDLKLMVSLARDLKIPFGVIINKAGVGDREVNNLLEKENIELLGEIPFDPAFAASYAEGSILENTPQHIRKAFTPLVEKIVSLTRRE